MKKVILCMMAFILAITPLAGCSKNVVETSSAYFEYVDVEGEEGGSTSGTESDGGTSSSRNPSGTSSDGGSSRIDIDKIEAGKDIDFGGATFTMAVTSDEPQYHTTSFKATISAFEKKYNCKIKTENLTFSTYNQGVVNKKSTGDPYDLCFMYGSMFPAGPIMGAYGDLTAAVAEVKPKNLDDAKTNMFKWNGKLYGVCNNASADVAVIYYNKLLFKKNGLEDPRTLYEQGKWTWDKVFEMGKQVTNPKDETYFFANTMYFGAPYGVQAMTVDNANSKAVINIRTDGYKKTLQFIQKLYAGTEPIARAVNATGDVYKYMAEGRDFCLMTEYVKYSELVAEVKKSVAFNKDAKNIGMVPVPLLAENTSKAYPTGWVRAISAGDGADGRLAVLWADFYATYKSNVKGSNELSDADMKLIGELSKMNAGFTLHGSYSTGDYANQSHFQISKMEERVKQGEDIAKVVDEVESSLVATVKAVVGNNYVVK